MRERAPLRHTALVDLPLLRAMEASPNTATAAEGARPGPGAAPLAVAVAGRRTFLRAALAVLLIVGFAVGARAARAHTSVEAFAAPFTSPPTAEARAAAAPCGDACVALARAYAARGQCALRGAAGCLMAFLPPGCGPTHSAGVILYGGALVDPRAYAPLARVLSERYSLPTVVLMYSRDLASDCVGERAALAAASLPGVASWVVAGHSMGGDAASEALRAHVMRRRPAISRMRVRGLALLGSYLPAGPSCGGMKPLDLSRAKLPTALIEASNDLVVNRTRLEAGAHLLPAGDFLMRVNISGGNHSQFGSYDPAGRPGPLHDGNATIPESVQRDICAATIADVAARVQAMDATQRRSY